MKKPSAPSARHLLTGGVGFRQLHYDLSTGVPSPAEGPLASWPKASIKRAPTLMLHHSQTMIDKPPELWIWSLYAGAFVLAISVVVLGIGLIRA